MSFFPPPSLPVRGSDDDVPAAAHLPQDGRPARPDLLPAAAALRGARPGGGQGAHGGGRKQRPDGEGGREAPGAGLPALLQHHEHRIG